MEPARGGDSLATLGLVVGDAGDVDGEAPTGVCLRELLTVALETADAAPALGRDKFHLLAHAEGPVDEGAGDDGAKAGNSEGAVDGQAGAAQVRAWRSHGEDLVHFSEERVEALAGGRGKGDDGCVFEHGVLKGFDGLHLG